MWLKLSTTLKYMPLTHICLCSSAELTCLLLYTDVRWLSKERSLARVFELREPLQRFLLERQSPLAAHFSDTQWVVTQTCLLVWHIQQSQSVNFMEEWQLCSSWQIKWLHSKLNSSYGGEKFGFCVCFFFLNMFQTLAEILKDTEPGSSFSQLVHDHLP